MKTADKVDQQMAMTIITADEHGKQVEMCVELDDDKNWEEECYQWDGRGRLWNNIFIERLWRSVKYD